MARKHRVNKRTRMQRKAEKVYAILRAMDKPAPRNDGFFWTGAPHAGLGAAMTIDGTQRTFQIPFEWASIAVDNPSRLGVITDISE